MARPLLQLPLTEVIPSHERVVLIEENAEIQIKKDKVLRFEARREHNGLPAVTIRDLLKAKTGHVPGRDPTSPVTALIRT